MNELEIDGPVSDLDDVADEAADLVTKLRRQVDVHQVDRDRALDRDVEDALVGDTGAGEAVAHVQPHFVLTVRQVGAEGPLHGRATLVVPAFRVEDLSRRRIRDVRARLHRSKPGGIVASRIREVRAVAGGSVRTPGRTIVGRGDLRTAGVDAEEHSARGRDIVVGDGHLDRGGTTQLDAI